MAKKDITWVVGGPQGSGVDSSAQMFAKAVAFGGLYLFGKREYYSNIMGMHSYFVVRVSRTPVQSFTDEIDILATFEAETPIRHSADVVPGGWILYDPATLSTEIEKVPTIEEEVKEKILKRVSSKGYSPTVEGILREAEAQGVNLISLPYDDLLKKVKEQFPEVDTRLLKRLANTMVVSASLTLIGFPMNFLEKALRDVFGAKERVIRLNLLAAELVHEYLRDRVNQGSYVLKPQAVSEERIYVNGNQAVALGKLVAGCTFQSYYPITPASDESVFLEANENIPLLLPAPASGEEKGNPRSVVEDGRMGGVVVFQTEDEIAAITAATGAALAGARAATATSGPGFSLMAEGLGWAGMNEVPVVVTLYQRGGPSTGLPTRHEQGDLLFACFGGHGEFPRIVYSSGDLEEVFYDTIRVFNYAESFQLPVIHILDKGLANSVQTVPRYDPARVPIQRGKLMDGVLPGNGYHRFELTEDGISPRVRLGTPGGVFWNTGDEHNAWGHISEEPENRNRMMEKRMRKMETILQSLPREEKVQVFGAPDARFAILSWGSPKGAILEAIQMLAEEGYAFKFVYGKLLWPVPARELKEELEGADIRIAIEQNYLTQFAGLVTQKTGLFFDYEIVKYNGRPMSLSEILGALRKISRGESPKRTVLKHGH
ncbi:MAG: 2-oxoacid:ferredoxin oxidoreductase subunit alpha [bacterium JZ-2024 1]